MDTSSYQPLYLLRPLSQNNLSQVPHPHLHPLGGECVHLLQLRVHLMKRDPRVTEALAASVSMLGMEVTG